MSQNQAVEAETPWLTVDQAAVYCKCSKRAFLNMHLPANDAGGRKVYHRQSLDAAIMARTWQSSTNAAPATTSTGQKAANDSGAVLGRLASQRLRPYKPRKKPSCAG